MEESDELTRFERRTRHLPHWEEPGATYFVRFGLRRPPVVDLTRAEIAEVIVGALRFLDGRRYWLYDYTAMPDQVHAILKPTVREGKTEYLWRITQNLKSWTAREVNRILGRRGCLWVAETYDRIVRDQADYQRLAEYILQNASRKGLIEDPVNGLGGARVQALSRKSFWHRVVGTTCRRDDVPS